MKAVSYLIKLASSFENKYSSNEDLNSAISPEIEQKRLENARKQLEAEKIKKQIADEQAKEDAQRAIEKSRIYQGLGSRMQTFTPKSQSLSEKEILEKLLEKERMKNQELKQALKQKLEKEKAENLRLKYQSQPFEEESVEEEPIEINPKLTPDRSYNY